MRQAFLGALADLARCDERILLLTADIGFMLMEPFRKAFPGRFLNVGVAEQNMIGVATGLAEAGFIPFAYSIATFASMRPVEFIRNGPVAHRLPVRVVGAGAGFGYGKAGPTHHAVEDVAMLRALPGLSIVVPADPAQAAAALRATWNMEGPIYYSLGKDDTQGVPGLDGQFALGRVQVIREGRRIALVAMGSIAQAAIHAADELAGDGIEATVAIVSGFHPDPVDDLRRILSHHEHAISVEAQSISGGLGALAASVIATNRLRCGLRQLAVSAPPDGTTGSEQDRWKKHGLDSTSIAHAALEALATPPI